MKYPNIKAAKITHRQIAAAFGFKNVGTFDRTTAHKRYMNGIEKIIELLKERKMKTDEIEHTCMYDVYSHCFIIDGMKFTPEFFKMMKLPENEGAIVKLTNIMDGILTFTRLD